MVSKLVQIDPGESRPDEQEGQDRVPGVGRCRQNNPPSSTEVGCDETNGSHSTAILRIVGSRYLKCDVGKVRFKAWDLGGHEAARKTWRNYVSDVDGIIYLVDASNQQRFEESRN